MVNVLDKLWKTFAISFVSLFGLATAIDSFAQLNPPYGVNWYNPATNTTINGAVVTKNGGNSTWNAGAVASNLLPENTSGWMEFVGTSGAYYSVGLSVNSFIDLNEYTSGLLIDHANNFYAACEGATVTTIGSWQPGDVFRISREGNVVNYYKNGSVVRSITVSPSAVLRIKTVLRYVGKSSPVISTSFDSQLILHGTVAGAEGNSTLGGISVNVVGGTTPYTYSWSSGEQSSAIVNKPQGAYTLTVTDAMGRTKSRTYRLGYKINWVNKVGVSSNGDILTKNVSPRAWGNAGASSSNILPAYTDGWVEFSVTTKSDFIVGLAANGLIDYSDFNNSIHIDENNSTGQFHEGTSGIWFGYWQTGDVFRISRESNTVKYFRNDSLLRSVNVNPAIVLKVKTTILEVGASTPNITASFDGQLILQGTVTGGQGNNLSGGISTNVEGGKPPYTYNWSTGEQTSSITNKPLGSYSLTVLDAVGRSLTRTYNLGYKINWINKQGVSTNGDLLTKNINPRTWTNSGAISSNILPANTNGWIEFTVGHKSDYIIGLSANDMLNYTEFIGCIQIESTQNIGAVYEGTTSAGLGYWQPGDVFKIVRQNNTLTYYRNDDSLRTVAVSPALILKVKVTIQEPGYGTPSITTSFDGQLVLQGTVTGTNGNSGSGGIAVAVSGGAVAYTYSWSSAEQTNSISNKQKGVYTLTVSDAVGRTRSRSYGLGHKVDWTNKIGVSTNGDILTKTSIQGTWTSAGAISTNSLPANSDGWIEFNPEINADFIVGLAVNNVIDYSAFAYGIRVQRTTNNIIAYEGASAIGLGLLLPGDVIRISREGNQVKYLRNGEILRTLTVNPALALKAKVTIQQSGRSSPNITASFWSTDGIVRTYYSIADGNWTTPAIWSLAENGPPSTVYPDDIDKVVIKGHDVTVNSNVKSTGVTITSTNENTKLKVEGSMALLTVKGTIVMNRENQHSGEVLVVRNNGRLEMK